MADNKFWRWYDRASRMDFGGTLLGLVFDWKGWVVASFGGGGGVLTFLIAAVKGRDPLDVWVLALVVMASLMAIVYLAISILEKFRRPALGDDNKDRLLSDMSGEVAARYVDRDSEALAGIVNSVMERAGSYNFKYPVPDGDPYLTQYNELKKSSHPIWTDREINQLRRDFLQYCDIFATRHEIRYSAAELKELSTKLHVFGRQLSAKLRGAEIAPAENVPDWPIHELFSHIDSDVLNDRWEAVGADIRDAFALGRLKVWGRLRRTPSGERRPFQEIHRGYWQEARFTYSFFDNTAENAPHVHGQNHDEFYDLHVNRMEALKIWS
ncbi:MAG: hypothetical protein QOJ84_173 [Bradyrhizobium sp.]|jgi:hypothetical protein|nr:hypothetical protein [Bradyrhizobium sp.]